MKRLLLVCIMVFGLVGNVYGFEAQVSAGYMSYNDDELRAGPTIEVRLKQKSLFAYGSTESLLMYGKWFDIMSVGVGLSREVKKGISVYIKGGYYMPQYDKNGGVEMTNKKDRG